MAVRADFPVLLDACVLAEASVADLYLRLSEEPRLLLPRWTEKIWDEVDRTCSQKLGWSLDRSHSAANGVKHVYRSNDLRLRTF